MLNEIVFQLAKRRMPKGPAAPTAEGIRERASSVEYERWRDVSLRRVFVGSFDGSRVEGREVLDFGCGSGPLSRLIMELGARRCVGVDLDEDRIRMANAAEKPPGLSFRLASDPSRIDLDDASVDVVVCFSVLEHVMEYEAVIREWYRVLRPGGRVLVHWQPWFHPWAHHGERYVRVPWMHVVLGRRERVALYSRIVDLPEFDPPWWDRDENGARINRFASLLESGQADRKEFLNELTMWRFERLARDAGFRFERRSYERFQGPAPVRLVSGALTRIPLLREFFTANAVYELVR